MKVYELKFNKGSKKVFRVSLVKDPAVEETLIKFNKEPEEILTFADEEKRIFYSVAMRPNKEIFRKDVNGEPAKVFYSKDFVEESQINYFRNNGNKNTNLNHDDENTEGVFPFESWIVKDSKKDKATLMGMEVLDGDWVLGYKVDSDEVWADVKEGKLDGLSIEATNLDRILKEDTKMKNDKNKKGVIAFVKEGLNNLLNDAEKMEGEVASVSKWWQTVTNDTFNLGDAVMRKPFDKDGESTPVMAGEYELKDGTKILTDSEGIIRFIFGDDDEEKKDDVEEQESDEEKKDEDEKMEEESKDEEKKDEDEEEAPTEKEKKLLDEIVDLKQTIAELKADKVKDDEELETMRRQTPGAESIPITPTITKHEKEKAYEEMSNYEKVKHNREL